MDCSKIITSIGLMIDITGALLVAKDYWRLQYATDYERVKSMVDTSAIEKRNREQAKNYPCARCGLILLVIGL